MAYDENLATRLRELLADEGPVTERRMFGGLAFLLNGNMSVSASRSGGLLVRIDPAETDAALARAHVERMEMRGRSMDGWVVVAPEGLRTKRELAKWVRQSVSYVKTLPPKGSPAAVTRPRPAGGSRARSRVPGSPRRRS